MYKIFISFFFLISSHLHKIQYFKIRKANTFQILFRKHASLCIFPLQIHKIIFFLFLHTFAHRTCVHKKTFKSFVFFLKDENGRTPLHWAASVGNHANVVLLLKNCANVDVVDNEKKTPIHLAVCSASPRIDKSESEEEIKVKLEKAKLCTETLIGAANHTVNWRDYEGRTALHLGKKKKMRCRTKSVLSNSI